MAQQHLECLQFSINILSIVCVKYYYRKVLLHVWSSHTRIICMCCVFVPIERPLGMRWNDSTWSALSSTSMCHLLSMSYTTIEKFGTCLIKSYYLFVLCVCTLWNTTRNEMERQYLECLQFDINVSSSVYAKYYFELRYLAEAHDLILPLKLLDKQRALRLEVKRVLRNLLGGGNTGAKTRYWGWKIMVCVPWYVANAVILVLSLLWHVELPQISWNLRC